MYWLLLFGVLTDHLLCLSSPTLFLSPSLPPSLSPFHTQIPHYNLPIATKAIKSYLKEHGLDWMYKSDNTWDFVFRTHKYFLDFGFKSHRSSGGAVEARQQQKAATSTTKKTKAT